MSRWFVPFVLLLVLPVFPAFGAEAASEAQKKIVFIAGGPSHGFGAHDMLAGSHLLADKLKEAKPGYEVVVEKGWPADENVFDGVAAIVIYCDGGANHLALPHAAKLDELSNKGVGIGCIHYAVEVPKETGGQWWLKWMGGYFETFYSINPHWPAKFESLPDHPVANGVKPFGTADEWYYNMRFREGMKGVTPILSAVAPDSTRQGQDDAHGGNPQVREAIGKNQKEHLLWVSENDNGSRGFGTTGGHVHWNWASDPWRKTVLNAIVWIARGEIPKVGIETKTPTVDEMLANHDEPIPANFDREDLARRIASLNEN